MALAEFALIRDYFNDVGARRADVLIDIGDDCAILQPPAGQLLAISCDTLVADVHFFADTDPRALGHKALAVNLSDLAACGAEPAWITLALTLPPDTEPAWLRAFAHGMSALATAHGARLIGGDTTSGPLAITLQVVGFAPPALVLRRDAAQPGDVIVVSGTLGAAGLALRQLTAQRTTPDAPAPSAQLRARLEQPTPRVALGMALRGIARAAIDLSDGLAADLGHILTASHCGATIDLMHLPIDPAVAAHIAANDDWELAIASGDDYELCFTVPAAQSAQLLTLTTRADCSLTVIGQIDAEPGLRWRHPTQCNWQPRYHGYQHQF